jgi:hypothetical protein
MKRIFLSLLLLIVGTNLYAQYDYLTLRAKNGHEKSVKISKQTLITFSNGLMQTNTDGETAEFQLSDIKSFFFASTPTAINAVTTDGKQAMLTREGIVVTAPAQTKVSVATLDGRSLISFVKQRNGMESRALSLPKGVYIVRVGDKSQKVLLP